MESIKGGPCPGCVCCKSCGAKGFQKIVELKEVGLVVYKYTEKDTNMDKETELNQIVNNEDVFIVHNKNNMKMKNDDMRRAMDKYTPSCPRCKKIIEHVHNLIEKVPAIDKNNIIGICNQCKMKEKTYRKQCECEKILKKFLLTNHDEKITLTNQMKEWIFKIQDKFKHMTYEDDIQRFNINIQKDETYKEHDYSEFPKDKKSLKFDKRQPQIELGLSDTQRSKSKDKAKSSKLLSDQLKIRYFSDEELLKIKKSILNYKELEADESQTIMYKLGSKKKVVKSKEVSDSQAMRTYSAYEEFPNLEQSEKIGYDQERRLGRRRSEEMYTEEGLRQYLIDKAQKKYTEIDGLLYSNKKVTKLKQQNVKDTVSNIKYVSDEETPETINHTKQLQKHDTLTPKSKEKFVKSIKVHSDSELSQIKDYEKYDDKTEKDTLNNLDTPRLSSKKKFKQNDNLRNKDNSDADMSLTSLKQPMDYDKKTKIDHMRRLDTERSKQRIAGRKEVIEEKRKIRSPEINRIDSRDKVGKIKENEKKKKQVSDEDIFRTMSKLTKHIDGGVGFSYYFPKEEKVVAKSVDVSSLELVKVTRDKIILKAKEEKEKKRVIEEKKKEERAKRLKEQEEKIRVKKIKEEEEAKKLKEEEEKIEKQKLKEEAKKQAEQEKNKLAQEKKMKEQEIKSKDQEKQSKDYEIKSKDGEIKSKKQKIKSKDQELQSKNSKREDDRRSESKPFVKTEKSKQADQEKVGKEVKSTAENEKSKPKEKKDKVGVDDTIVKDKEQKTKDVIIKDKEDKGKGEATIKVKEKGEKVNDEPNKKDKEKENEKIKEKENEKGKGKQTETEKGEKVSDEPPKKDNDKGEKVYDEATIKDKDKAIKDKSEATKNKDEATKDKEKSAKLKEEASIKQKELLDKERLEMEKANAKEKEKSQKGKAEVAALANEKLKQMLAQQAKIKEEQEKKAREIAEKKAREAAEALNKEREVKPVEETAEQKELNERFKKKQIAKNLDITHIKVRKLSNDDDIFNLIQLKQKPTCLSDINITNVQVLTHKGHKNRTLDNCVICKDSDIELDIESITRRGAKVGDSGDIVIGKRIFKYKHPLKKTKDQQDTQLKPMLFKTETTTTLSYSSDDDLEPSVEAITTKGTKMVEPETGKGVIRYALSDRAFIDKGWTMLPTEKVVRKMNVYRMRPAHPEFDWFAHNKHKRIMTYDTGEKLADFNPQGRGRWYYKNGRVALDYYDAEEMNAQQRFVIYSSGEPDERDHPRPVTVLATFDYLGNGVVFDHRGKIRLKYNQTEGVVLDRSLGPVSHWKWHTLNDPPVLQQVMIDTFLPHKDPGIANLGGPPLEKFNPDNEEMLAIEFDNFVKEKSKKLSQKFKPFQIKMKALKINENFSLRVLDQATVYLIFREGPTNLKLNLGMILNHQEIIDTDTAEVGEVSNALERLPARTDSLAGLQRGVAYAQRVEHSRAERERHLRRPDHSASIDRLKTGLSKPLRPPPLVYPSSATPSNNRLNCVCRKPYGANIFRDTRLI